MLSWEPPICIESELTSPTLILVTLKFRAFSALLQPGLYTDLVLTPTFWLLHHLLNLVQNDRPPLPCTD